LFTLIHMYVMPPATIRYSRWVLDKVAALHGSLENTGIVW
jgi:hypothetical protein